MSEDDKDVGMSATLMLPDETLVLPGAAGTDATLLAKGTEPARPGARRAGAADPRDAERYEILEEIGRGGLGRVVRARDTKLARTVALKQLHQHDAGIERRFMSEALVTARLQHPSIVPIYDTSSDREEPFYAMKLIAGRSLAEVLGDTESFTERLALVPTVLAIANALAYAHAQKIIHRDLKPHNVIVGEFGETVVIDWGLAKDLASGESSEASKARAAAPGETVVGDVMGTPAYMAPEQARGEPLDERADVFALGAILYHVLAGRPPYAGVNVEVTIGLARLGKSPALAALAPDAPPDLVAIANTAMALDPAKRYASAAQLAEDLAKFQTGQLVGSYRYSTWQLLRRFVRRHRAAVTVAAVLLAVLAVASTLFVRQIQEERDVAEARRVDAEAQRATAERRKLEADTRRAAADDLIALTLAKLEPGLRRLGRLDLMRDVANHIDTYYDRVTNVGELDRAALAPRGEATRALGNVLELNGDLVPARRALERSRELLAAGGSQIQLANVEIDLALVLQEQGDAAGALAQLARTQTTLASLPNAADVDHARARLLRRRGILETAGGKLAEAGKSFTEAIAQGEAAAKLDPKLRGARAELAASHDRLADIREATGDLAGAIAEAKAGLAVREAMIAEDPGDIDTRQGLAVSWDKLFYFAVEQHDFAAAAKAADAQLAVARLLVTIDPDNDQWQRQLGVALERPARIAYEKDDGAAAVKLQEQALAVAQTRARRNPDNLGAQSDLSDALAHLGDFLTLAKQPDRAIEVLRRAQKIMIDLSKREPANVDYKRGVAALHELIASVYFQLKEYRAASDEYRARMDLDAELLDGDKDNVRRKVDLASSQFLYGISMTYLPGKKADGLALAGQALATFKALDKAGQLTPDMATTIAEREKIIASRR